jgi:hypothetical protein
MRRILVTFLLAGGALIALPAGAHAATTLGETFEPDSCAEETYIQTSDPGNRYTVPFDGVITRWSIQTDASPPPAARFKVGRVPPGADLMTDINITIVGQSALESLAPSSLNTFGTQVPVKAGDKIGEYVTIECSRFDPTYIDHYCCEDVQPGTTELFTEETFQQNIAALLEPDCDQAVQEEAQGQGEDAEEEAQEVHQAGEEAARMNYGSPAEADVPGAPPLSLTLR